MSTTRVLFVASVLAAVLPGLAAGQDAGEFDARVNLGGVSPVELGGFAWSEGNEAEQGWFVQMVTPGGGSSIVLLYAGAGRPPTGEYPIVDLVANDFEPPAGKFIATGSVDPQHLVLTGFHSKEGTILITSSTPGSVGGSFEFRASGAQDGSHVTVEGTFRTANKGD